MLKASKSFVIKDPVHGYVRVAPHERIVIDHPVTQRLRWISQTGLVQFVFPEARTARFSHSLGAMHLASRFLVAAIENAASDVRERFFQQMETTFAEFAVTENDEDADVADLDELFEGGNVASGGLLGVRARIDEANPSRRLRKRRLLTWAESGLRLAALFHDLGHPPFSHDFEFALKDYLWGTSRPLRSGLRALRDAKAPHEVIGHALAPAVLRLLVSATDGRRSVAAAFWLAERILDAEPHYTEDLGDDADCIGWLHSLVDGEVDVDRADYLLRDGRNIGVEFGGYDLERLVDNIVLAYEPRLGFITAVHVRGLQALEAFLLARLRSNQTMLRHQKVAQCGAAFHYATVEALKDGHGDELLTVLERLVSKGPELTEEDLRSFARFDDSWWVEQLRSMKRGAALRDACVALVLRREPTLRTLWKRADDIPSGPRGSLLHAYNRLFDDKTAVANVEEGLRAQGVIVRRHGFTPFKELPSGESVIRVRSTGGQTVPATTMSQALRSIRTWYSTDLHFHLFARTSGGAQVVEKAQEVIAQALGNDFVPT